MASKLRALLEEVHRRSIWQILIAYGVGSWFVLGAAGTIMDVFGLPDWVPQMAGLICLMALPLVLATAFVEKTTTSDQHAAPELQGSWARRWLTWKRVGVLIPVAFALLGTGTTGYMGMRVMGIGPVGSLYATGVLDAEERIVLADFGTRTVDSTLVFTVTDAFRVDLSQSSTVKLAAQTWVADVLGLMERDPAAVLDLETAREVAIRGGLKAVIAGEINALGSGFMLTTRIVAAETGEELVSHRETAEDVDALIPAIERLSRRLRERIGESLKTIRRTPPLDQVRTASLEALRLYSEANRATAGEVAGGSRRCLPLLTDAIALDTLFGAAYELRGVCYDNLGMRREQYADYMRAYELRDRMTAYERAYATGHQYAITGEYEKAVEALEAYHDLYPDDPSPLNILGYRYFRLRDFAHSEEMFVQASESYPTPPSWVRNGVFRAQVNQGKYEAAEETLRRWEEAMPEDPVLFGNRVSYAAARWEYGTVQAYLDFLSSLGPAERASASMGLSALAAVQGKVNRAEQHFQGVAAGELERLSWLPYLRLLLLGDTVGAIDMVEAVLDRSPLDSLAPDGKPYLDLARFYARAGRPESARELLAEYDTVIREFIDPSEREHRRGLDGVIALAEGRPEQAIPDLRLANERVLDSPIFYLPELGMAFQQAGEPDSALVQYERYLDTPYLDRYRDNPFWLAIVYERLAALYEERGEVEDAVEYYGKFAELWKDCDPELRPRVEAAERAIGRLRGGR